MAQPNDTKSKEQTQKRILIATVLSFAFFIAYDFLYMQPKQKLVDQANAQNAQTMQQDKSIQTTNTNNAPVASQSIAPSTQQVTNVAPSVVSTSNIISRIETQKNTIEIDSLGRIHQVILKEKQYVTDKS